MDESRPSPEEFLRKIKSDEPKSKGKLKIFFGACAGVGKTFSMLSVAQEKLKDNVDVIIGIVETHGRIDTIKQLEGLPVLPLKKVMIKNITLSEFDLDEAIKRDPDIILIDELAHSNLFGSRHPKRWQDIVELLDHGINVYTTLNVQHIDSLNDIVAQITAVKVRETIPDSIFDDADEIVLVDIPSEVILERLSEGKVYLGELTQKKAAQNFFKIENLVALREIALRRVAEQVEAEKDLYSRFKKTGKTKNINHILVCIKPGESAEKLIRIAKQYAVRNKAIWTVLYIESKEHYFLSKIEVSRVEKNMHQAQLLGANTMVIPSLDVTEAIVNFAKEKGIRTVLIGKTNRYLSYSFFSPSIIKTLLESSEWLDIYVMNLQGLVQVKKINKMPKLQNYFKSLFILFSITMISYVLRPILAVENVLMFYFMAIIFIAISTETIITILSVFLALLTHHYLFHGIDHDAVQTVLTLVIFMLASLLVGVQTNKLRIQNHLIRKRAKYNAELYAFTQKLLIVKGKAKIVKITTEHISHLFNVAVLIWEGDNTGQLQLLSHKDSVLDPKEESAAIWCFENNHEAGKDSDTIPSARGYYLPLSIGDRAVGTLGIIAKDPGRTLDQEEKNELLALVTQATLAFERVKSSEKSEIFNVEYDN